MKYAQISMLFCMLIIPGHSFSKTGNDMVEYCDTNKQSQTASLCLAYLEGTWEGFWASIGVVLPEGRRTSDEGYSKLFRAKYQICAPDNAAYLQFKDIFTRYLLENPNERHVHASVLYLKALRQAFPCQ